MHLIPVSSILTQLSHQAKREGSLTLAQIVEALEVRGFALVLLLFALPMAIPFLNIPGLSALISLPLFFFTWQMSMGRKSPWLPEKWSDKRMEAEKLTPFIDKALPHIQKMERWLTPRHARLTGPSAERAIGVFSLILTCCIALPLSMITNLIPAIAICIMALGLLSRDGRAVLLGVGVGIVGLIISIAAVAAIGMAAWAVV